MEKKFDKKEFVRREFGEMLQAPKTNPEDPNEKPRYYFKITAKDDILQYVQKGTILELEDPAAKYKRMIDSTKTSDEMKQDAEASMKKIPKFFVKRLLIKIPKAIFKGK